MGNGVVYITNHDRKYSSMKRVCDELKAEGQISAQCRTLFIEDGAEWDASLAAAMQGSNLVIVHLMKNAMNTPLWNHCRDFLCDNKVPFFIDANDGDVQDSRFIDDDKLARFKLYCLYGGPENYKICGFMRNLSMMSIKQIRRFPKSHRNQGFMHHLSKKALWKVQKII